MILRFNISFIRSTQQYVFSLKLQSIYIRQFLQILKLLKILKNQKSEMIYILYDYKIIEI
jgi:hypothetical protein